MADPAKLARAQHSYNLLIGLEMTVDERAAMLDRVLARAGQAPLGDVGVEAVSRGMVEDLAETGLTGDALAALIEALYAVDLAAVISEFLVEMTGEAPGEAAPMPEPEVVEVEETTPEPQPTEPPDWTWDVVLSAFDPTTRRHTLTLLRGGGSVCSAVSEAPEGFGPLVDRLSQTLPEADPVQLEVASQTFHTPPCPDLDVLIEALLEGRDAPEQLYLVEITHALPNPCLHRQRFQITEPGDRDRWQGRRQELLTEVGYQPAGLSIRSARTRTVASWGSPARLKRRGQDADFRPPLLAPGPLQALPLQCDWQLRAGWAIRCTPRVEAGPTLSVTGKVSLRGSVHLAGEGHLQELLAGSAGMAAGVLGEDGRQVHTGEEALPTPDWEPAADVGFGALGVLSRDGEGRDLAAAGLHLSGTTRPPRRIAPRLARQEALSADGVAGGGLSGAVVIDASAQLSDALSDAQSIGSTAAGASADLTVRLTLTDGARSVVLHLTAPDGDAETHEEAGDGQRQLTEAAAGAVEVDGTLRHRLRWRAVTTTLTHTTTEALDAVSDGDWLGSGESLREPLQGRGEVAVAWVSGGYALEDAVDGEE